MSSLAFNLYRTFLEECSEWIESVGLATGFTPRTGAPPRTPQSGHPRGAGTPGGNGYPAANKTPAPMKHLTPVPMRMTGGLQKMTKDINNQ